MKYILTTLILLVLLISCSKNDDIKILRTWVSVGPDNKLPKIDYDTISGLSMISQFNQFKYVNDGYKIKYIDKYLCYVNNNRIFVYKYELNYSRYNTYIYYTDNYGILLICYNLTQYKYLSKIQYILGNQIKTESDISKLIEDLFKSDFKLTDTYLLGMYHNK